MEMSFNENRMVRNRAETTPLADGEAMARTVVKLHENIADLIAADYGIKRSKDFEADAKKAHMSVVDGRLYRSSAREAGIVDDARITPRNAAEIRESVTDTFFGNPQKAMSSVFKNLRDTIEKENKENPSALSIEKDILDRRTKQIFDLLIGAGFGEEKKLAA